MGDYGNSTQGMGPAASGGTSYYGAAQGGGMGPLVLPAISIGAGIFSSILGNKRASEQNQLNKQELELRNREVNNRYNIDGRRTKLEEDDAKLKRGSIQQLTPMKMAALNAFMQRLGLSAPAAGPAAGPPPPQAAVDPNAMARRMMGLDY